ncbi:MAG: hypothetical protein J6R79_00860 [Bacteroidaceae bacterium]|nr:hypothetical protein [Bacteroidaceae bacterium]
MEKYTSISASNFNRAATQEKISWKNVLGLSTLQELYSSILEEELTINQTLRLVHVQVAALLMLILSSMGLAVTVLCVAWFAFSLWHCYLVFSNKRKEQ